MLELLYFCDGDEVKGMFPSGRMVGAIIVSGNLYTVKHIFANAPSHIRVTLKMGGDESAGDCEAEVSRLVVRFRPFGRNFLRWGAYDRSLDIPSERFSQIFERDLVCAPVGVFGLSESDVVWEGEASFGEETPLGIFRLTEEGKFIVGRGRFSSSVDESRFTFRDDDGIFGYGSSGTPILVRLPNGVRKILGIAYAGSLRLDGSGTFWRGFAHVLPRKRDGEREFSFVA
jgi:hypothetical protein